MKNLRIAAIVVLCIFLVICAVVFAVSRQNSVYEAPPANNPFVTPPKDWGVTAPSPDVEKPHLSKSKIGWGLGPSRNDKNQPIDAISAQNKYGALGGQFIFPDDAGVTYLTFDLGYENGYTEKILDALDARGVKGTFFITMDYALEAPHIVQRIVSSGHTLANHTVKHPSMPALSDERITIEIMDLHKYIKDNYDYDMTLFRYPMGEFSEYSLKYIDDLGYKSIFWSFAYVDWLTGSQPGHEGALAKLTNSLHDGGIYLLHTVSSTNAAIMDDFLDNAIAKGYRFGLVDERLGLVKEQITNKELAKGK